MRIVSLVINRSTATLTCMVKWRVSVILVENSDTLVKVWVITPIIAICSVDANVNSSCIPESMYYNKHSLDIKCDVAVQKILL